MDPVTETCVYSGARLRRAPLGSGGLAEQKKNKPKFIEPVRSKIPVKHFKFMPQRRRCVKADVKCEWPPSVFTLL